MRWLRSCRRTSRRARVQNLLAVRSTSGRLGVLGMQGCCSTTKALRAGGVSEQLHRIPSPPTLRPPPLQQAGELLLQPLLQQRQL